MSVLVSHSRTMPGQAQIRQLREQAERMREPLRHEVGPRLAAVSHISADVEKAIRPCGSEEPLGQPSAPPRPEPLHLKTNQADDGAAVEQLECKRDVRLQELRINSVVHKKNARPLAEEEWMLLRREEPRVRTCARCFGGRGGCHKTVHVGALMLHRNAATR